MECVILAGGLGTRMHPITQSMPKWLLPVLGKPFADYQLDWLQAQGVERVIVAAGHLKQAIDHFVADSESRFTMDIIVSDDGEQLLGTGGGLRKAAIEHATGEGVLVLYGDSYLTLDVAALWQASAGGHRAVMSVYRNDGMWDVSNAAVANGMVTHFEKGLVDPRAAGLDHIDYGMSVVPVDVLRDRLPAHEPSDLADLSRRLSSEGALGAFVIVDRFYEVGSPEGLKDLEDHLTALGRA